MEQQKLLLAAVVGNLLLTALHGLVHAAIPIFPTSWRAVLAGVLLYLLPVTGVGLAMSGYRRAGAAVLLGAGVGGFAFEGASHFLFANPDQVGHVADHRAAFGVTAALTTVGDLLLVWAAWFSVRISSEDRVPASWIRQ